VIFLQANLSYYVVIVFNTLSSTFRAADILDMHLCRFCRLVLEVDMFAESYTYCSLSGLGASMQTIVPPTPLYRTTISLTTFQEEYCCFKAELLNTNVMAKVLLTVNRSCLDASRRRRRLRVTHHDSMYKRYTTQCARVIRILRSSLTI
jgi:hypothetical protein